MSDTNAPEPTMEEILASIRRIISEDEPPPAHAAAAEPEPVAEPVYEPEPDLHQDVLELTEPLKEAEPVETIGDLDIHSLTSPPAAPVRPLPPVPEGEPLVGEPAAQSAASAFGSLAQHVLMPAEGRTLEDVVRELLRPMLKQWLDTNLPGIVQAKVDEEVARIARRRL